MASIVKLCNSERSKPKGAKYLSYDASGALDIMKRKENGSPLLRESGDSAIKVKTALRSTTPKLLAALGSLGGREAWIT